MVDEVAVVAHEDERPLVAEQLLLEQLERLDVEVVGGLVHDEQVAGGEEEAGEEQAGALAAGEGGDGRPGALGREEEVLQVAEDVAPDAVHDDVLVVAGEVLADGGGGVERRAELVEEGRLDARAEADGPRLRGEAAEEEAGERRLAGAVGADQGDALAAEDRRGEVAHDGLRGAGPGVGDALELGDDLARAGGLAEREAARPDPSAAAGDLLAEAAQPLEAADVAGAAGGDAVDEPLLLGGEALLLALPEALLLRVELGAAPEEGLPVAVPAREAAAVEVEDAARRPAQEGAVVRDEDAREAGSREERLEPLDRRDVEVVRRLVEQQQPGLRGEGGGEADAAALAAGEVVEARGAVDPQLREEAGAARRVRAAGGGRGAGDDLRGGAVLVGRDVLREVRDAEAGRADDGALVGLEQPRHHLEQRGLALAVAAGDAGAVALLDVHGDAVEDLRAAEGDPDLLEGEQRHAGGEGAQAMPSACCLAASQRG